MKKLISFVLTGFMVVGLAGCSGEVSQKEYDELVAENERLKSSLSEATESGPSCFPNDSCCLCRIAGKQMMSWKMFHL